MIEKFSDYEGSAFLSEAGTFEFTVEDAEVTESKSGNTMVKFTFKCDKGTTNAYHVLSPNARWTYNKLIAAALKLTEEQKKTFELDYETVHNQLLGKTFWADVTEDSYEREIKKPMPDGTYETGIEMRVSYKIDTTSYRTTEEK